MSLYLATYSAIARNVSPSDLEAAWAAVPHDVPTETLLGLVPLADRLVVNAPTVTRAMTYRSGPAAIAPDPQLGQFLVNLYTTKFARALSTPVSQGPVGIVPSTTVPLVWLNADAANGPTIALWPDLSGHGNDYVQAVALARPLLAVDVALQKRVASFGGTQLLNSAAPLAYDDFTIFETTRSPLLAVPGFLFERSVDALANPGENVYQSTGAQHSLTARRVATVRTADVAANWLVDGLWHLVEATYHQPAAPAGVLSKDGAQVATFANMPVQAVSDTGFLGARSGPVVGMSGSVREFLIYGSALPPAEAAAVGAYMRAQVGI